MKTKTYYHILDISPRASDEEVHRAWRNLALRWHPDRNQNNRAQAQRMFVLINRAYTILKTKPQRQAYNRHLLKNAFPPNLPPPTGGRVRMGRALSSALIEILWPFTLSTEVRHG